MRERAPSKLTLLAALRSLRSLCRLLRYACSPTYSSGNLHDSSGVSLPLPVIAEVLTRFSAAAFRPLYATVALLFFSRKHTSAKSTARPC